jgi:RNA polymerase sigma-70 factor (family 1)
MAITKNDIDSNPLASRSNQQDGNIIDEERLIQKLMMEDPAEGCRVLFRKYYQPLCSHAIRLVYSREVAEDLVADLFCRLWSDKIYLNITSSYRAYLFKAIRHSAFNYIKWELSKNLKHDTWENHLEVTTSLKPEETLLFEELTTEIGQVVEQLPAQCKKVFVFNRFENKKYKEIALELGISVKAVEAHISRALDTIRKKLKEKGLLALVIAALPLLGL